MDIGHGMLYGDEREVARPREGVVEGIIRYASRAVYSNYSSGSGLFIHKLWPTMP